MSINSIPASSMVAQPTGTSPSIQNALSSSLDVASSLTLMMNALLQNVLKSAQQQPGLGATPGLGTPGLGSTQSGGNGLAGLLQSLTQLLSAVTPLLQALSGGMGANQPATQFASQLPGNGMGIGPQVRPASTMPMSTATLPSALGAAGQTLGTVAGGALGGPTGAAVGGALGGAAGTIAGTAINAELGVPANNTFSANTPAQIGGMSRQSALAWAQANGGANMQASDITQGMNLYSIFNTGNRMF